MIRFSERYGLVPKKIQIDRDVISPELRNKIWNIIYSIFLENIWDIYGNRYSDNFASLSKLIRHNFLSLPIDERYTFPTEERDYFKKLYLRFPYYRFYDFLEFLASISNEFHPDSEEFIRLCNKTFVEEMCQFRFIHKKIAPISDPVENEAITEAVEEGWGKAHIQNALELYKKRPVPDYRNSIKESILAVEAVCRIITDKKHNSMRDAVNAMENNGIILDTALKNGILKIYGWTSGKNGIRHALLDNSSTVGEAEARLMLVMCSTFVNYLKTLEAQK